MFNSNQLTLNNFHLFLETKAPLLPKADDNKGALIAAILTPMFVIIIAAFVITWLWKIHKRKVNFMGKEIEIAVELSRGHRYNPS